MLRFYTWTILLIHQLDEIGEKQFSVFGSRGGQIYPLMHVPHLGCVLMFTVVSTINFNHLFQELNLKIYLYAYICLYANQSLIPVADPEGVKGVPAP